jgi:hypothetical protein
MRCVFRTTAVMGALLGRRCRETPRMDAYEQIVHDAFSGMSRILRTKGCAAIDTTSSLAYLDRVDVRRQAVAYISSLDIDTCEAGVSALLGLAYGEIRIKEKSGKRWAIRLWPCSSCACVGLSQVSGTEGYQLVVIYQ